MEIDGAPNMPLRKGRTSRKYMLSKPEHLEDYTRTIKGLILPGLASSSLVWLRRKLQSTLRQKH